MLRKLNIGTRLITLITVQAVVLLAIGAMALYIGRFTLDTMQSLNAEVAQETRLIALADGLRSDLVSTVHAVNARTGVERRSSQRATRSSGAGPGRILVTCGRIWVE